MSYRELGEARILKTAVTGGKLLPKRAAVKQGRDETEVWQPLDQLAAKLVHGFQPRAGVGSPH